MVNSNRMHVVYGDGVLGLHHDHFEYLFSYERGSLESMKIDGREWLYRPIYPTYWRASTSNDLGNGFSYQSAQWMGADVFPKCTGIDLTVDGRHFADLPIAPMNNQFSDNEQAQRVVVCFTYTTATRPATQVTVKYVVEANGEIMVTAHYHGCEGLPSLPIFGLRMVMPTAATRYQYTGLSNETYPDRLAGGQQGTYNIAGMPLTPYLVPQEMGMHMKTEQLIVTRETTLNNADQTKSPFQLRIDQQGQPFNFSLLPYTAQELEAATHLEELPVVRRAVLVLAGAVRGVGGIDSWGANVEPKYTVPANQDYQFSIRLNKQS
ncbi:beta-galactosidase small subunit [uncultured Limosilactobacillus sp.]|uniref:beta-galactosidase small subunit n=1 Tax=uncultured Limosilactobacillus sp. TaxID=2837629 RepID=UPI0025D156F7|nr:beta-galactosidase small subunit [uncultured Limosilactobacillus sp.]